MRVRISVGLVLAVAVSGALVADGAVNVLHFGDVMVERRLEPTIAERGTRWLMDGVQRLPDGRALSEFDLVVANLEGAVTTGGEKAPPDYPYDFAFRPERIAELVDAGISFFTISNNHTWDQGAQGVVQTRHHLGEIGVAFTGDVDGVVSDYSLTVVDVGEPSTSLAIIGVSEVYRGIPTEPLLALVRRAEAEADLTLVTIHWGIEYEHVARDYLRRRARQLVDAGADAVIAHHPHVVQGIEIVSGAPVAYSLGNFIFDQAFSERVQEGLAVELEIADGRFAAMRLWPFRARDYQPAFATGALRERMLSEIAGWSFVAPGDDALRGEIVRGEVSLGAR